MFGQVDDLSSGPRRASAPTNFNRPLILLGPLNCPFSLPACLYKNGDKNFMQQEEKGWYTIGELAKKIQLSDRTVWSWIRDGKLQSTRYGQQHRITELQWQEIGRAHV